MTTVTEEGNKDIFALAARNRLRLATIFSVFTVVVMGISGGGIYLIHRKFMPALDLWLGFILFWSTYLLFAALRFALGGRWVLRHVETVPSWRLDRRLENALAAARLGAGITARVRLLEIPDADINSFSIALPDGSYAVFATRGLAVKLPRRQREAVMAHELAHIAAGDTALQSMMLRLVGPGDFRHLTGRNFSNRTFSRVLPTSFMLPVVLILAVSPGQAEGMSPVHAAVAFLLLFAALASALPGIMYHLMRLFLDREREYFADLHAAFVIRDPEAVYLALKNAAHDVRDLLLLPSHLDAVLFHPVSDYTSYRPFRTQPTMAERMQRLQRSFPGLSR